MKKNSASDDGGGELISVPVELIGMTEEDYLFIISMAQTRRARERAQRSFEKKRAEAC